MSKSKNKKNNEIKAAQKEDEANGKIVDGVFVYYGEMTLDSLCRKIGVRTTDVMKSLLMKGKLVTLNTMLNDDMIAEICLENDLDSRKEEKIAEEDFEKIVIKDDEKDLVERAPVVTIMGHVDHGKTTLIDTIRDSHIADGEAGFITQEIGAYQKVIKGKKITFLDTPGHEAFTAMRARGASVTDIVVIVVAADDGVMPQTKEAIDHALAANVPIIVAINKIDKPGANPEKVKQELSGLGLISEDWGGDIIMKEISAKKNIGIDDLLENILLVAELKELKANPNRPASGSVIEATLDRKEGAKATLLVQNGTLHVGDYLVVGSSYCKVRKMTNEYKKSLKDAPPSTPVSITGLSEVPTAGDNFMAFPTEKDAKLIAEKRRANEISRNAAADKALLTLDTISQMIGEGETKNINVLIKADSQGSAEALKSSLLKIDVPTININIIRAASGEITEGDVILAEASGAIIYGFNVKANALALEKAKREKVEIRSHTIIYNILNEMEQAAQGMLQPTYHEVIYGQAEVRSIFKASKVGIIAGSYVTSGKIKSNSSARVIRNNQVVYDGKINSLKRFKDDVKEVNEGFECGIVIDGFKELREMDIIESYGEEVDK